MRLTIERRGIDVSAHPNPIGQTGVSNVPGQCREFGAIAEDIKLPV